MRSFSLLQESIIPYIPSVITQLTQKLLAVSKVKKQQKGHLLPFRAVLLRTHVLWWCSVRILKIVQYFLMQLI